MWCSQFGIRMGETGNARPGTPETPQQCASRLSGACIGGAIEIFADFEEHDFPPGSPGKERVGNLEALLIVKVGDFYMAKSPNIEIPAQGASSFSAEMDPAQRCPARLLRFWRNARIPTHDHQFFHATDQNKAGDVFLIPPIDLFFSFSASQLLSFFGTRGVTSMLADPDAVWQSLSLVCRSTVRRTTVTIATVSQSPSSCVGHRGN
jgi:hypothetical protein